MYTSASRHGRITRAPRRRGFTLAEVMVSTSLSGMLIAGVLGSFVLLQRSQVSLMNYADMNREARQALELLGRDLRSAVDVHSFNNTHITLVVPTGVGTGTQNVTYSYHSGSETFERTDPSGTRGLIQRVDEFSMAYRNSLNVPTTSRTELKQVQVRLRTERSVLAQTNSQYVLSAQFTMRAKPTAY